MYNKSAYEKLKVENPEKLKEFRKSAYEKYKETNPEKLAEIRRLASAKYYANNKEKVIQRVKERQQKKKQIAIDEENIKMTIEEVKDI
jgi:hypothetical protein